MWAFLLTVLEEPVRGSTKPVDVEPTSSGWPDVSSTPDGATVGSRFGSEASPEEHLDEKGKPL